MHAGVCLINIARAEIVDEGALYEALRDRRIASAALDVWDPRYPSSPGETCFCQGIRFMSCPTCCSRPTYPAGPGRRWKAGRAISRTISTA